MGMGTNERENHAVEAYLRFLATGELPVDHAKAAKLEALDAKIEAEPALYRKAQLIGQRHRIAAEGATKESVEAAFLKYVDGFVARNPYVTYAVWREMGVPPAILKQAGVEGTPATVRAPGQPRRTRNNLSDPETARRILSYIAEHGPDAACERFNYSRGYINKVGHDLATRFPDIATEVGYDHAAIFPMAVHQAAARAATKGTTRKRSVA